MRARLPAIDRACCRGWSSERAVAAGAASREICGRRARHHAPAPARGPTSRTACCSTRVTPGAVVLPGIGRGGAPRSCAPATRRGCPGWRAAPGTGLSGGATAGRGRRADRALAACAGSSRSTSPTSACVVEPGVTNIDVSQAVGPTHFYPPDPSSQIVCSIGGNVAENSGGAHCFKYGFTTNYVTGLELVLPDGPSCTLGGKELDQPGLRPARRLRRLRGDARRGHARSGCEWSRCPRPCARWSPSSAPPRRPGEVVSEIVSGGHRPGRDRDDGQALDPGRRGSHRRRLPDGRRSGAGGRARRLRGRVRDALRARSWRCCEGAGADSVRVAAGRGRARADLAHAQGRLRRDGPDRPELLRAGQRDPAHAAAPRCSGGSTSSPASTTCASRTCSTPATATCTRSSVTTAATRARRSAPRSWPGLIVKTCVDAGRLDHRRARRRRRQEALHAGDVRRGRPVDVPAPALRVRPRRRWPTPARSCRRRGCAARCPAPTGSIRSSRRASRSASDGRERRRPPTREELAPDARRPRAPRASRCASAAAGRSTAGAPPAPSTAIELPTGGLDRIVEHNAGDLTAVLEAGVPLARAQAAFAEAGPDAGARPARRRRRHDRRRRGHGRLGPAARTATAARATWWSACAWRSRTARSRRAAAR